MGLINPIQRNRERRRVSSRTGVSCFFVLVELQQVVDVVFASQEHRATFMNICRYDVQNSPSSSRRDSSSLYIISVVSELKLKSNIPVLSGKPSGTPRTRASASPSCSSYHQGSRKFLHIRMFGGHLQPWTRCIEHCTAIFRSQDI